MGFVGDILSQPTPQLQDRIQKLIGVKPSVFQPIAGGYTPAARWLIYTDRGQFFAKKATTPLTAAMLRREGRAYLTVQGSFMPQLIGWEDHESEPLLIIEDLSEAAWPPPWSSARIDLVLQQLETLHHTPAALPTFFEMHGERGRNWTRIAVEPEPFLALGMVSEQWVSHALPILIEAESGCSPAGNSLTHWDIRSNNLCFTAGGVKFVDWAEACLSNPKLDLGFWLPSLAYEGGPVPDTILPHEPEIAAWVAGFFAARAGLPDIPDAPFVRRVQREQLETALPWAMRALDLST